MKKNLRRVLSLCLALVMVLALLPVAAFAVEDTGSYLTYKDQNGEEQINSVNVAMEMGAVGSTATVTAHNDAHPEWTNSDYSWVSSDPTTVGFSAPGQLVAKKPGTVIIYAYQPDSDYGTFLAVNVAGTPTTHKVWLSATTSDPAMNMIATGKVISTLQYRNVYIAGHDTASLESNIGFPSDWTYTISDENVLSRNSNDGFLGPIFVANNPGTAVVTATSPEGTSVSVTVVVTSASRPGSGIQIPIYDPETNTCPTHPFNIQHNYNSDLTADPNAVFTVGDELYFGGICDNESKIPELTDAMRGIGWYTWHTSDPSVIAVEGEQFMCEASGNYASRAIQKFVCKGPGIVELWATDTYPNIPLKVSLIVVEPGHVHDYVNHTGHFVYPNPDILGQLGFNTMACDCGFYMSKEIPAGATEEQYLHEYEVTDHKDPTATEDGYDVYTCSCGATKTEVLPATGTECPSKNFVDVPGETNWAHAGIDYVVSKGLMNGIDATHFAPADDVTRAMLVTILWANEGKPAVTTDKKFSDVPANKWYAGAVAWAAENGIVSGRSATTFAPDDAVTRQDLALILKKYAEFKGISGAAAGSLDAFADKGSVSKYAQNAVAWAVANGIISGSNEGGKLYLNPADSATRGQTAAILMKFFENVK